MASLSVDSDSSYKNLIAEIDKTVNNNERLFREMKTGGYDKSRNYESDLKNYKLNKQENKHYNNVS